MNERTWLVIVYDTTIGGYMIFHVRNVVNALAARKAIVEEFKRQEWGEIALERVEAYRLPQFKGNRNIAQICKVFAPQEAKEPPLSDGMPIVEWA